MSATEIEIPRSVDSALARLGRGRGGKSAARLAVFDALRGLVLEAGVAEVAPPRFSTVPDGAALSGRSSLFCAMALARAARAGVPVRLAAVLPGAGRAEFRKGGLPMG